MSELKAFIQSRGIPPGKAADATMKLMKYRDEVLKWNDKVNLTSITNPEEFIQKHFIDSLLCVNSTEFKKAKTIIDVGTGAGFPGIPLAVLFPEKQLILLDSLQKRLKIVKELADDLNIENVRIVHGRAEDLAREPAYREKFDLCVSRAVANLSTLAELCLPFVKTGGTFIAYKGPDCDLEIAEAQRAIKVLGGKMNRMDNTDAEGIGMNHVLIYINKVGATPKHFPRKAGTPGKQPIL